MYLEPITILLILRLELLLVLLLFIILLILRLVLLLFRAWWLRKNRQGLQNCIRNWWRRWYMRSFRAESILVSYPIDLDRCTVWCCIRIWTLSNFCFRIFRSGIFQISLRLCLLSVSSLVTRWRIDKIRVRFIEICKYIFSTDRLLGVLPVTIGAVWINFVSFWYYWYYISRILVLVLLLGLVVIILWSS